MEQINQMDKVLVMNLIILRKIKILIKIIKQKKERKARNKKSKFSRKLNKCKLNLKTLAKLLAMRN